MIAVRRGAAGTVLRFGIVSAAMGCGSTEVPNAPSPRSNGDVAPVTVDLSSTAPSASESAAPLATVKPKQPSALAARVAEAFPSVSPACVDGEPTLSHRFEQDEDSIELACRKTADVDLDGYADDVVLVKDSAGHLGLAVLAHGPARILIGAGKRGQTWMVVTDDDTSREPVDTDLDWLASWSVWPVWKDGRMARGFSGGPGRNHVADDVGGDGLFLSGGDAASVAYFDGSGWRLLHLGF